jgi:CubicO group peptidase (beta-lactamase class C family)
MRAVLVVLIAVFAALGLVRGDGETAGKFAALDEAVARGIARGDCPGAVVLVLYKGEVVHRKAYGKAAVEPEARPMTLDAVFDLASLTKPIATALAVHLLVQSGKLSLDAAVAKYRPSFGKGGKDAITVEQLLLHTSGLLADNPVADYADGREKALEKLDALGLLDPPGSRFRYSDVNYILLGSLVESVSGEKLDAFCRQHTFEPLGMKETTFNPGPNLRGRCVPTEKADGKFLAGVVHDPRARKLDGVAGHAGLFSTADDLARFCRMLLDGGMLDGKQVIPAEVVRRLTTPRPVPLVKDETPPKGKRTLGFDVQTSYSSNRGERFPAGTSFGHTGFTGTSLWLDPESKTAVIFLSSRLHPAGKGNVTPLRREVATLAAVAVLGK